MTDLENRLIGKGVRPTAMRLLILDYLEEQSAAVDLGELEINFTHADRVTLYRTLKTFEKKGIIHRIMDGDSETKYALCFEDCHENHHHDMHAHFKCRSCHETFCLHHTAGLPEFPPGFSVERLNTVAYGICPQCKS